MKFRATYYRFLLLLSVVTYMLGGCSFGSDKESLRKIYSLDSAAINALENKGRLPERLDSLRQVGVAVADTDVADLSFDICERLLKETQYARLHSYAVNVTPSLQSIANHERPMKRRLVSINIDAAETFLYLGMQDRFVQTMLHEIPTARRFNLVDELGTIYLDLGMVYNEKGDYDRAISYINQSMPLIDTVRHRELLVYNLNNLAWSYRGKKNMDKALEYMMLAIHHISPEDTSLNMKMHCILADHFMAMKEYSLAEKSILPALAYFERTNNKAELANEYHRYGLLKWRTGNLNDAREYLNRSKGLQRYLTPPNLSELAQSYAKLYQTMGNKDSIIVALFYSNALKDSILKNSDKGETLTSLYDEELERAERNQNLYESSVHRYLMLAAVMLAVVIATLFAIGWWRHRQLKIQHAVEEQRDELQQQLLATTAQDEKYNELMTELTGSLQELQKTVRSGNPNDTMQQLRTITSQVMSANRESDTLQQANNDFFKRVLELHPSLTPNDLRLAAFLRQGLSSKEIADITYREPRSVDMARSRLRKKMGLPKEQDLITYFARI